MALQSAQSKLEKFYSTQGLPKGVDKFFKEFHNLIMSLMEYDSTNHTILIHNQISEALKHHVNISENTFLTESLREGLVYYFELYGMKLVIDPIMESFTSIGSQSLRFKIEISNLDDFNPGEDKFKLFLVENHSIKDAVDESGFCEALINFIIRDNPHSTLRMSRISQDQFDRLLRTYNIPFGTNASELLSRLDQRIQHTFSDTGGVNITFTHVPYRGYMLKYQNVQTK
jgi:hypothetical protein